ncbi:MAG: glycosyl hydrolase family 65 protein [Verrucomicrobiota bacterium JB022]|nr:glycosyl hydrolase family 65 protein [Verrucomicrobiota bacterium JB022]
MEHWKISTSELGGDAADLMRRQIRFQIANGYMGYRGTLDEDGPEQHVGVTLAGIFDRVGEAWREPVNAPNGGYTAVSVDGVELTLASGDCARHEQALDLAAAVFSRQSVFQVNGKGVTLQSTRFLSAANPHLGVVRYTVTCDAAASLRIRTGIDGNIWDLNGPHLPGLEFATQGDVLLVHGKTQEQGIPVAVAEAVVHTLADGKQEVSEGRNLHTWQIKAEAGKTYTFDKFFAVATGNDSLEASPREAVVEMVRAAAAVGFEPCLAEHRAEWQRRWERADVVIEGDDDAQLALRFSILQLLMAAPVEGSANSIPARALSGQVYKGAIFWDTEMFMYPMFLYTWPEAAAELLRYRIHTLDGARRKAQTEGPGYRGAFYAWESQETGDDACSYFNVGDPHTGRELRTHFRDKQIHVSGDIAIAMWQHFLVTGDDSLLLEGGADVILECARFYYSYAYYKADKRRYEFLDVIGPDEYHERVNNNAFTNRVAYETLRIALELVEHLRAEHPDALEALIERLQIADELPAYAVLLREAYVPEPDPQTGLIEQFEGYFKLDDVSIEEVTSRKIHPNEYLGAGQGLAVPTQVIKQADVIMMMYLFRESFAPEIVQANWDYYEPRTEHGSSLSACAYALTATEIGRLEEAYRYFIKTASIDLKGDFKLYAGTIFMGGTHPAACGGAWLTTVFGFAGVGRHEGRLAIRPRLYPRWTRLRFSLVYQKDHFTVDVSREVLTVQAAATNRQTHQLQLVDRIVACAPGAVVTESLSPKANDDG